MKKYILTIFCILFAVSNIKSDNRNPRLFSIIFTDTQDESIGYAAKITQDRYLNFFTKVESAIGSTDGPETLVFKGFECSNKNLITTLDNLSITPNDVVIFVYVGHGTRASKDPSNFPQMCFAVPKGKTYRNEADFYPLERVRNIIMRKNPRFCLVIGDCCNSPSPSVTVKDTSSIIAAGADIVPTIGWNEIKRLFLSKYGSVIITASIKGEYGWCTVNPYYPSLSGMFLERNFNDVFKDIYTGRKHYDDWNALLTDVKNRTYKWSQGRNCIDEKTGKRYYQTPYFEINLSDEQPKDTIIIDTTRYSTLKHELVRIADDIHSSDEERINNMRRVLGKYFDGNKALVDIVGMDNKTIIASPTIKEYLLELATGKRLVNITILEQEKDHDGKIFYLKVHEVYREK